MGMRSAQYLPPPQGSTQQQVPMPTKGGMASFGRPQQQPPAPQFKGGQTAAPNAQAAIAQRDADQAALRGRINAQRGQSGWPSNPNMGGKPAPTKGVMPSNGRRAMPMQQPWAYRGRGRP